jgi:hypothetical protein
MAVTLTGCTTFTEAEKQAEADCQRQGKHAKLKDPLPPGVGVAPVEWICVD